MLTVHVVGTKYIYVHFSSFLIKKSSHFQSFCFSPKSSQVLIVSFKLINPLSNKRSLKRENNQPLTSCWDIVSQAFRYYSPWNLKCQHLCFGQGRAITNTLFLLETLYGREEIDGVLSPEEEIVPE